MSNVKIVIPNYVEEKISKLSESSLHLGDNLRELIENSLSLKAQDLNESDISSINNIFMGVDIRRTSLIESIQEMRTPVSNSIKFWDSIIETANLPKDYINKINKIKSILEETGEDQAPIKPTKKESIEGDGEDPENDIDGTPPQDGEQQTDEQGNPIDPDTGEVLQPVTPEPTPEQLLQLELAQTDNKFMTIVLYNKMGDLITTIDTIMDTVSSSKTEENLDLFQQLELYQEYLNILLELIFVMDLNTVYYNFTNISLEVNDLLDKYLISTKVKTLNDPKATPDVKKDTIDDLRTNLSSKIETNQEIQDEGME